MIEREEQNMTTRSKAVLSIIACLSFVLAPSSVSAVELGNAAQGLSYARTACATCHLVENDGPYSPNPDAPTFKDIANTPGMTGTAINVWLQTSHPTMPDLIIPQDDTDNLIAYITSLRTK